MIRVVEHTVTMYILDRKRNDQRKLKYRLILVLIKVLILLLVWKCSVILLSLLQKDFLKRCEKL